MNKNDCGIIQRIRDAWKLAKSEQDDGGTDVSIGNNNRITSNNNGNGTQHVTIEINNWFRKDE